MPTAYAPASGQGEVDALAEEAVRDLDQDAGTVADVGLGVGGAAVVEVAQRLQPELHHAVRAAAVHVGHERHAAAVVLEAGVVEALSGRWGRHRSSHPVERWIEGSRACGRDIVGPRRSAAS